MPAAVTRCTPGELAAFRILLEERRIELGWKRTEVYRVLKRQNNVIFQHKDGVLLPRRWLREAAFRMGIAWRDVTHFAMRQTSTGLDDALSVYVAARSCDVMQHYLKPVLDVAAILMDDFCGEGWNPAMQVETDRSVSVTLVQIMLRPPGGAVCHIEFLENQVLDAVVTVITPTGGQEFAGIVPVSDLMIRQLKQLLYPVSAATKPAREPLPLTDAYSER